MATRLAPVGSIQPGLERIGQLLKNVPLPWKSIHVGGTNGKGSICTYASAMLRRKQIRTGSFTSPHLIDRWDCISIDLKPVERSIFERVEQEVLELNTKENINASEFEILTATAFKIFTEEKVRIGVVEVGMGGKLDATNILQNQVVSVISKIGLDHQQFLGSTVEEIASHKAGISRPSVPYIVNPKNTQSVRSVIDNYAQEIGAGPHIDLQRSEYSKSKAWCDSTEHLVPFQKDNALCAFHAVMVALKLGEDSKPEDVYELLDVLPDMGIGGAHSPAGRLQQKSCAKIFGVRNILLDGAHNLDAVNELAPYIEQGRRGAWTVDLNHPDVSSSLQDKLTPEKRKINITWVFAMSGGRNPREYFSHLLKPGDNVITVEFGPVDGMPWVKATPSSELLQAAHDIQPQIKAVHRGTGLLRALYTAKYMGGQERAIVVTGSLYLIGDILRLMRDVEEGKYAAQCEKVDLEEQKTWLGSITE